MKYEGVVLYVGLATEGLDSNKLVLGDYESYSEEAMKLWGERHGNNGYALNYSHYDRSTIT